MSVRRVVITVLLLIGLPLLGVGAGFALLDAWKDADAGRWQSLGTPPEMPTAIVDADIDAVYVRGQGGSLFECDRTGPTRENACWKEIDQPPERDSFVEHRNTYRGEIPPPPGQVKESLDVSWQSAERSRHARYALLEDGSIWHWDYHGDANFSLVLLAAGPICGLALAIVIVLVMWLGAGLRALLRRREVKADG